MDETDIRNWNFDYETTVRYLGDSQTLLHAENDITTAITQLTTCVASILNQLEELKRKIDDND